MALVQEFSGFPQAVLFYRCLLELMVGLVLGMFHDSVSKALSFPAIGTGMGQNQHARYVVQPYCCSDFALSFSQGLTCSNFKGLMHSAKQPEIALHGATFSSV